MSESRFDIQKLVNESGVPRRTIYFYVQQGVLPPPQGAGLAAYYGEDHLLRLRLIPVLRQQGLRLDEIRARFASMGQEELRQAYEKHRSSRIEAAPRAVRAKQGQAGPAPQTCLLYHLSEGIMLTVSDNIRQAERQRVQRLLDAARRIFDEQETEE
jgi:DNA-binding transcriptional MerR regulator